MHPGHWSPGRGDPGGEEEGGRPLAPVLLFTFPALLTIMSLKVSELGGGGGSGPPEFKTITLRLHFVTFQHYKREISASEIDFRPDQPPTCHIFDSHFRDERDQYLSY